MVTGYWALEAQAMVVAVERGLLAVVVSDQRGS